MKKIMALGLALAACWGVTTTGCSDDDEAAATPNNTAGSAGSAGSGTAGTGGSSAGSAGTGGSSAGSAGTAGAAGGATGPALCKSSGKNAFETYGSAFGAVNDAIIGNVAAELGKGGEPGFGPSFGPIAADPAKLETLKTNLADFLVLAYGGPNNYKGKSMKDAHVGLDITQSQYDFFITNVVVKALADKGVPTDDITSCFAPAVTDKAFVADIVTK